MTRNPPQKIKRGEIYWINLDPTVGSEVKKTRPGIVVSNNIQNEVSDRVIVIPITSNMKQVYSFEVEIMVNGKIAKAMADQIRAIDKSRLQGYINSLQNSEMVQVEKAIKLVLRLE